MWAHALTKPAARIFLRSWYRVRLKDLENIPPQGRLVLIANHISFLDAIFIHGYVRRPIRFVMAESIYKNWWLTTWLFRALDVIPIEQKSKAPEVYERAFTEIAETLRAGGVVCIFPEGSISRNGIMQKFKPGVLRILEKTPSPVVPLGLTGLWETKFSRKTPRRLVDYGVYIGLATGSPIHRDDISLDDLYFAVASLANQDIDHAVHLPIVGTRHS